MGNIFPIDKYLSTSHLVHTGNAVDEFTLSIAINTGNTDNFTCPDIEGNIMYRILLMCLAWNGEVFYLKDNILWLCLILFDSKLNISVLPGLCL